MQALQRPAVGLSWCARLLLSGSIARASKCARSIHCRCNPRSVPGAEYRESLSQKGRASRAGLGVNGLNLPGFGCGSIWRAKGHDRLREQLRAARTRTNAVRVRTNVVHSALPTCMQSEDEEISPIACGLRAARLGAQSAGGCGCKAARKIRLGNRDSPTIFRPFCQLAGKTAAFGVPQKQSAGNSRRSEAKKNVRSRGLRPGRPPASQI